MNHLFRASSVRGLAHQRSQAICTLEAPKVTFPYPTRNRSRRRSDGDRDRQGPRAAGDGRTFGCLPTTKMRTWTKTLKTRTLTMRTSDEDEDFDDGRRRGLRLTKDDDEGMMKR